ncbi:hypothetical protein [uncultured Sphingomonas sp.]|uniref:hypothetical protein n=1 Tax=uncultured Sphingomonas sp. TaxID=158754 RepID=UPI0025EDE27D|nr:hypothetical protein [uncultured Sphingomonas sp.]
MRTFSTIFAASLCLCACAGPKEQAGAAQDEAAANAAGIAYNGEGPAERIGRAEDRADRAAADARDAQADALKDQRRVIRSRADAEADKLEDQARAIRAAARDKSDQLDQQVKALRQ